MHRRPFDDRTVDRLLDGRLNTDDVPLELVPVVGLVVGAKAPASRVELRDQDRVVDTMVAALRADAGVDDRTAVATASPAPDASARRTPVLARLLTAKVGAIALSTVVGVTGAAAATGALAVPANVGVVSALSHVVLPVHRQAGHPPGRAAVAPRRTPTAAGAPQRPVTVASDEPGAGQPADPAVDTAPESPPPAAPPAAFASAQLDQATIARLALCAAAHVPDGGSVTDGADPAALRKVADAATAAGVDLLVYCRPGVLTRGPLTILPSRTAGNDTSGTITGRPADGRTPASTTTTTAVTDGDPLDPTTSTTATSGRGTTTTTAVSTTSTSAPSTTSTTATGSAATSTSTTASTTPSQKGG
jgi:hypothetical protein